MAPPRPSNFSLKYKFKSPSGSKLKSHCSGGDTYTRGETRVYNSQNVLLYKMPVFSGRRDIRLSDDGGVVILDGDVFFGTRVMKPPSPGHDPIVTSIYCMGKLWREVRYVADLNGAGMDVEWGGGWSNRKFDMVVDWERGRLVYDMDGSGSDEGRVVIDLPRVVDERRVDLSEMM